MNHKSSALNPDNYKIGPVLFGRIWRLAKPYWTRPNCWSSWLSLAALMALVGGASYLTVQSSQAMKEMTDLLIAKDGPGFTRSLLVYIAYYSAVQLLPVVMGVFDNWINLDWRSWLTTRLVDQYLSHRTYYDIAVAEDLDNPDQRIQENVAPFVNVVAIFPREVLSQIATIVTGLVIVGSIDGRLIVIIAVFGVVQLVATYLSYVPTVRQNFEQQVAEADLRHGLLHVRENAEAVAFYQGEKAERTQILARLATAVRRGAIVLYYNVGVVMGVGSLFSIAWMVMPYLLLAPRVFSGELSFGSITQGIQVATQVLDAITSLAVVFPMISQAAPQAVRLAHIQERLEELEAGRRDTNLSSIAVIRKGAAVHLDDVSLETPGGEQRLVRRLSVSVGQGENLAIVGQTGVGKSSLLRAMAGLWTRGTGSITMPPARDCLFLPQRPYMILADLRSQLLYPHGVAKSDAELQAVLEAVCLPDLLEKHGGLDAVRDWGKVLSLGEQQRVAFARVLISEPKFAFLDEATSAVDHRTEEHLYRCLRETGASFISIGHRLSILDHHTHILTLEAGGGWSVDPLRDGRAMVPGMIPAAVASDARVEDPLQGGGRPLP